MNTIVEIRPRDFVSRWPSEDDRDGVTLLDVREHEELERAALPFAKHIPMGQVPERLGELDAGSTIVVMCHGGVRSMRVATFLAANGFPHVVNLAGGIDAWAVEVDDTIPRY